MVHQWMKSYLVMHRDFYMRLSRPYWINPLRPRQNGRHFADDIFKCIFLNENVFISIKISLKFIPKGPINNIPALIQIMVGRRPGDKPLSEPMMVKLPTHICVTRPQWIAPNFWHQHFRQSGDILMAIGTILLHESRFTNLYKLNLWSSHLPHTKICLWSLITL